MGPFRLRAGANLRSLLENFPDHLLKKVLILPSARRPISESVHVKQAVPFLLRPLPYVFKFGATSLNHYFSEFGIHCLNQNFLRAIQMSDPDSTIAYFWPDPPRSLVQAARNHGLLTVREMINTFRGTARIILEEAYDRLGLKPDHNITDESVERERDELALYDYVFASNPDGRSLAARGGHRADAHHTFELWLVSSPFCCQPWRTQQKFRLQGSLRGKRLRPKGSAAAIGCVGKSGVKGELVLVGDVENAIKPLLTSYCGDNHSIRVLDFVS